MIRLLLLLLICPLQLARNAPHLGPVLLSGLATDLLGPAPSPQLLGFVLPALAASPALPLASLARACLNTDCTELSLPATPGLLYCLLLLSRAVLPSLQSSEGEPVLAALALLVAGALSHQQQQQEEEGQDDDGDSDEEEEGGLVVMRDQDSLLEQAVALLNTKEVVAFLVSGSDSEESLAQLCLVCHQLLLYNSQAMYQYNLLYTLAFAPRFLHRLWAAITATCQVSVFSSPTPLISLLARGITLSAAERDKVVPRLAVFSSLFGYLLVTIHDSEFYGSDRDGATQSVAPSTRTAWMPFTLAELVNLSLHLRDIALGLVELAYPESRPAVRGGDYSAAVGRVGLAQFYVNLSVEFMPLYQPNQQEVKDPKLFANNVRQVMADRLGVPTTNSFYNYLKMEKCKNMIK